MRFMCTQVACQNQINVLTVFLLAKKFACDEYDFIGQSEMVFYGFFQRLVIPVAVQKDRSLWERDCPHGVQDVTSVDLPSSGEREHSKQSLTFLCPLYLV